MLRFQIDYNCHTNWATPFIFGKNMPLDKTFPCMSIFLPLYPWPWPQNLRLGFKICIKVSKIVHNSNANWGIPLIFGIHLPWDKTFPCMSKFWSLWPSPWPQSLRSGFKICVKFRKWIITPIPIEYTFNIWHRHAFGQDLSMHVKKLTPVIFTSESVFRFQYLC